MTDTPTTVQRLGAELLGTFVLVFFGCGAALASGGDYVATGLSFGLTVVVMAYAVGRISGGHFNPAVSVGAALGGRIAWKEVGLYVAAQLVGGILAGAVLWVVFHGFDGFESTSDGLGQNFFGDESPFGDFAWWAALIVELVATFVFLMVILAVTDERNEHPALAPLAIGLSLAMIHFATIGLTGTSVNPARSIGVGLFAGGDAIVQLWLFIVAPIAGAALAGFAYPAVFGHGPSGPLAGSGLAFGGAAAGAAPAYADSYQQQWNQQGYPQGDWGQQPQWDAQQGQWTAQPDQGQWGQPAQGQPGPASWEAQQGQWGGQGQWAPASPDAESGAGEGAQPGQWQPPPAGAGQAEAPSGPSEESAAAGQQWAPEGGSGERPSSPWSKPDGGDDSGRTQIRPSDPQ